MNQHAHPLTFAYDDLAPNARDRARDWYRHDGLNYDWWECVYSNVIAIAEICGFEICTHDVPLISGCVAQSPSIWFDQLYCQGENVTFDAHWTPLADPSAALDRILTHASTDDRLHAIVLDFAELSERCKRYGVYVRVDRNGSDPQVAWPDDYGTWHPVKVAAYEACYRARINRHRSPASAPCFYTRGHTCVYK